MGSAAAGTAGSSCPTKQDKCMAEMEPEWMSVLRGRQLESVESVSPRFQVCSALKFETNWLHMALRLCVSLVSIFPSFPWS